MWERARGSALVFAGERGEGMAQGESTKTRLLIRNIGLLLSGDCLSGPDAVRLGLAYRSFAPNAFEAGVRDFMAQLAGRDRAAVTTIKKLAGGIHLQTLAQGLDDEISAVVEHITDHGVDEFRRVGASS